MKFPYSKKVLEHFKNPKNVGRIEDADGRAIEGSPACGDMVAVYLKVDDKGKIEDVKFESYGCASNIATGSIITELSKGKTIEEAKKITWKDAADALGGLPPIKTHCSVLAVDGLKSAIENYEEKHGLVKKKVQTTPEIIEKRLRHVMNPLTGLDIVRTKLVTDVSIKNGIVTIYVDLPESHQFANNIKEEIKEKIETLWDVEKLNIHFSDNV